MRNWLARADFVDHLSPDSPYRGRAARIATANGAERIRLAIAAARLDAGPRARRAARSRRARACRGRATSAPAAGGVGPAPPSDARPAPIPGDPRARSFPGVPRFFTIPDLEAIGVPRSAVRRLVDDGRIRATRPGKTYHLNAEDVRREIFAESAEPARAEPEPSEWARDRVRRLLN